MRRDRPLFSRRSALAGLAAASLTPCRGGAVAAAPGERIVALDAPSAEMLFALGLAPVAMSQPASVALDPAISRAGIVDIGHYYEPNAELLQELRPDLIIRSFAAGAGVERLGRIAPIASFPIYGAGRPTLEAARLALGDLARRLDRVEALNAFDDVFETSLRRARAAATRYARALYLATLLPDGRHIILYGASSLFEAVMRQAGIDNAWRGPSGPWGIATASLEKLLAVPEAALAFIDSPTADAALKALRAGAIWNALPCVRAGLVFRLPALEMYGALPTALRFARLIADGALHEAAGG